MSAADAAGAPVSRRDLRAGGSSSRAQPPRRPMRRRTKVALWVVGAVVVVLVLVALLTAWVAARAFSAKDSLEAAQSSVQTIQEQAAAFDVPGMQSTKDALVRQTSSAVSATSDPLYRFAEVVPVVGPNLTALREISGSVDLVTRQAVAPLTDLAASMSLSSLAPVDGRINLQPIADGRQALTSAEAAIRTASAQISAVDTSGTMSQVADAKKALESALPKAAETTGKLRGTVDSLWAILGGDGQRNYLLVSPNNAEITALGGGTASMSMLTVDRGAVAITDQANSTDFPFDNTAVLNLDGNVEAIFPNITKVMNWATSRPDFPTAAKLIEAWWGKVRGTPIDGVISVDPIALSYLLEATGPIGTPDGGQLTAQNAVATLLNEVYIKYQGRNIKADTDAYFAATTKAVFDKLLDFKGDPQSLLTAFDKGVKNGSIMAYLNDPAEQKLIQETDLAGVLPSTNREQTLTGVYFRDVTSSKNDFYLETTVDQSTNVCQNRSAPTFTTSVTLHSTLTEALVSKLPNFILGTYQKGRIMITEVYVYGPVGSKVSSQQVVQAGVETELRSVASDMGRPVARYVVSLAPGQSGTVTVTFSGAQDAKGAPAITTSPMINPTTVRLDAPGCK